MQPIRIKDKTRTLGVDQGKLYAPLHIRDDKVGGINMMRSLWKPSPNDMAILNDGGAIRLNILGTSHPPVSVEAVREEEEL